MIALKTEISLIINLSLQASSHHNKKILAVP